MSRSVLKGKVGVNLFVIGGMRIAAVCRANPPRKAVFGDLRFGYSQLFPTFVFVIEQTGIQHASKVRSTNGLLVHCYGKLAVACLLLVFYP